MSSPRYCWHLHCLAVSGFYNSPFQAQAEELVLLSLDDEEMLQGQIDLLVPLSFSYL